MVKTNVKQILLFYFDVMHNFYLNSCGALVINRERSYTVKISFYPANLSWKIHDYFVVFLQKNEAHRKHHQYSWVKMMLTVI